MNFDQLIIQDYNPISSKGGKRTKNRRTKTRRTKNRRTKNRITKKHSRTKKHY